MRTHHVYGLLVDEGVGLVDKPADTIIVEAQSQVVNLVLDGILVLLDFGRFRIEALNAVDGHSEGARACDGDQE